MMYPSFYKRLIAYLIDYFIISIPLVIFTSIIAVSFFNKESESLSGVYPFMVIYLTYFPHHFFVYLIEHFSISNIVATLQILIILNILEATIFTFIEKYMHIQTIGKRVVKIRILGGDSLSKLYARNFLRGISKYVLIPYLSIFFVKDRQTLYDIFLNTKVVED